MTSGFAAQGRRLSMSVLALTTAVLFLPGVPAFAGDTIRVDCPGDSLQEAIDAAEDGDRLYVVGTCVGTFTIAGGQDLEIEGGSATLDGAGAGPVVRIEAGASLHLVDNVRVENGVADFGAGIYNSGHLNADTSSFSNNRANVAGGAIYNEGTLRTFESYFDRNHAVDGGGSGGGGAIFNAGYADIGVSWFDGNRAPEDRGGAILNLGDMTVWESELWDNYAKHGGSAIASGDPGSAIPGHVALENVVTTGHIGPAVSTRGPMTVVGSTFFQNAGAALVIQAGTTELSGSTFRGNEAAGSGVLRIGHEGHLVATDILMEGNSAQRGGAIAVLGGGLELANSRLSGNAAAIAGGGIFLVSGSSLVGSDLRIEGNSAGANGGGILIRNSAATITSSTIAGNNANDGAGIANTRGSTTTVSETTIARNNAANQGGGVFNAGSDIWLTASNVASNTADSRGGGMANIRGTDNGRIYVTNTTIARNEAPRGAAIDNLDVFVALDHATVTENTGSAAFYEDKSPPWTTPVNSIIAGNPDGDCSHLIQSGGGNVVGDCMFADENGDLAGAQPTDVAGVDDPLIVGVGSPHLRYYMPSVLSPAVDRIPAGQCTQSADQEGQSRPVGDGCDSGSIEALGGATGPELALDFEFGHVFRTSSVTVSGFASDDQEIWKVNLSIKRRLWNDWLQDDLVTWGPWNTIQANLAAPNAPTTRFSLQVDLAQGEYSLAARAVDRDRNYAEIVPYRHFQVRPDHSPPIVDAGFVANAEFSSPAALAGTATDNVAVERMLIAIRNRTTQLWLQDDMDSWSSDYHGFTPSTQGLGTPSLTWSLEVALEVGIYSLSVRGQDAAGNWGNIVPWRPFTVVAE